MNQRRAVNIRLPALCAGAAALWAVYFKVAFVGWMADPIWYLEPARSLVRGWGLVTRIMLPAQVAGFPQGFHPPVPFLHHGPVAPLLLGLGYELFGFKDWTPFLITSLFSLATGCLTYWLGRRMSGEKEALTAAGLMLIHPIVLEANVWALTDAPFILFSTMAFAALWQSQRDKRWLWASGALLGLASSTRLAGQVYWPGFLFAVWWLHRDWRALGGFSLAMSLSLIPLVAYNHAAAGIWLYSPGFYALNWSPSFPGFRSSTTYMNLTSLGAFLAYPMDFLQKSVTGPLYAMRRFLTESNAPWTMACVGFGLMTRWSGPAELFRKLTLCVAVPVMVVNAVLSYGPVHYLDPLFPMFMIMGSLFFWRWQRGVVVLLALMIIGSTALWVKDEWKERPRRQVLMEFNRLAGDFLSRNTKGDEVVYTDSNRLVVWYADRAAIALTATREDAEKTFKHLPPDALFLTSQRIDSSDYDEMWREAFYKGKPVMGFERCKEMNRGEMRAVLFRRPGACQAAFTEEPGRFEGGSTADGRRNGG